MLKAVEAGQSWQEAMARIDGKYYQEKVKDAAARYIRKQREVLVDLPGYERFLDASR